MRAYDPGTQAWTLSYLLTDHLGSTVGITDASGTLIAEQRYLPFGEMRKDVGTIAQTDFGYTGQRDLGMGVMDYKERFYSPGLGRFLQPDTLISDPGNPEGFNRYSYVNNMPVNANDPSGHDLVDRIRENKRRYGKREWSEISKGWNRDGTLPPRPTPEPKPAVVLSESKFGGDPYIGSTSTGGSI